MSANLTKKRRERERERRQQQIGIAARRLFLEKGFNKTTIDDIAQEAEISPATIYVHFKSKEELYASLYIRILKYLFFRVEQINEEREIGPLEKFDLLKEAMYDVYKFDPYMIINLLHLQSSQTLQIFSDDLKTEIIELSHKALTQISIIFEDGIHAEIFINKNPIALADAFCSLFSGIVLWMTNKNLFDTQKDHIKPTLYLAYEIFTQGIRKK